MASKMRVLLEALAGRKQSIAKAVALPAPAHLSSVTTVLIVLAFTMVVLIMCSLPHNSVLRFWVASALSPPHVTHTPLVPDVARRLSRSQTWNIVPTSNHESSFHRGLRRNPTILDKLPSSASFLSLGSAWAYLLAIIGIGNIAMVAWMGHVNLLRLEPLSLPSYDATSNAPLPPTWSMHATTHEKRAIYHAALAHPLEQLLSTNIRVQRGTIRWVWTFMAAPLLTVLCVLGVMMSLAPSLITGMPDVDPLLVDALGLLFTMARVAFLLHVVSGVICACLAVERGQPIVLSGVRGFASGFIAVADLWPVSKELNDTADEI